MKKVFDTLNSKIDRGMKKHYHLKMSKIGNAIINN